MAGSVAVGVRWRLGAGPRKSVLPLHIASAGAWPGGAWPGVDLVMAAPVFTAGLHRPGQRRPRHQGAGLPGTGLAVAFVLAVFKPWGRIRRRATG